MLEICSLKLNIHMDNCRLERVLPYLSEDTVERIRKFRRWEDVIRTVFSHLLVKYMIQKKTGLDWTHIIIGRTQYGKPYVKHNTGLHFNVSHSGEYAVVAVSDMPVGIDIEEIKPVDFYALRNFFTKGEFDTLMLTEPAKRLNYFYELWTLKESYIKALGKGLDFPLDCFHITYMRESKYVLKDENSNHWFFKRYEMDKRYKMSVCSLKDEFPDAIDVLDSEEFMLFTGMPL